MHFSTLLKIAATAVSLIYSVEAAANIFPVNAVGNVAAVADGTTSGITHVYYQDKDDGDIKLLCTSTAFVQGGSQTCLAGSEPQVVVPANETLYGTPLAVMTINNARFDGVGPVMATIQNYEHADANMQNRLYYFTPNWTLGEFMENGVPSHGAGCTTCITRNQFQVEPGSVVLYAIGTTPSKAFRRRVGFISRENPNTITEATFNANTEVWSLTPMPG
ncbi:hypothetical protein VKT23_012489 [Stygiomarasmius scandens]|uniref:Uncharacterized protein n=1 Tax=Marasmiellus scandens TaxID=2682957 RepID=A0ABR1J679_9AGAR